MYPKLQEKSDVIYKEYKVENKISTYEQLIENISRLRNKEKIDDVWYYIYQYYKSQSDWNKKLEADLKGLEYTNLPEKIKKRKFGKIIWKYIKYKYIKT